MSIKSRMPKILKAKNEMNLILDTKKKRFVYGVRGFNPADNYQIVVEEVNSGQTSTKKGMINFATVELICNKANAGYCQCKGQQYWMCYHSLAAFLKTYETAQIFDTYSEAISKLLDKQPPDNIHIEGTIIKLTSPQNNITHYAIIPPEKKPEPVEMFDPHLAHRLERAEAKARFEERVNILRGPVEKGIE